MVKDDNVNHRKHSTSASNGHDSKRSKRHEKHDSKRRSKHHDKGDDDEDDEDEWVEKESAPLIATSTRPIDPPTSTFSVGSRASLGGFSNQGGASSLTDGYGEGEVGDSTGSRAGGADGDFFGSLGIERKRKEKKVGVDPTDTMGQSSRELNKSHWQPDVASSSDSTSASTSVPTMKPVANTTAGSSGSSWRMSKLKRTYEAAEEEGRPLEEVVLERYGSRESWEEAKEEKRTLDERDDRRRSRGGGMSRNNSGSGTPRSNDRRFVYHDSTGAEGSRPSSRAEFKRPGEVLERFNSNTGRPSQTSTPGGGRTPIPNVFTPPASRTPRGIGATSNVAQPSTNYFDTTPSATPDVALNSIPVLTQSELNKLQATVLKAKLLDSPTAAELEVNYEKERVRTLAAATNNVETVSRGKAVQVLPTLDAQGRLYDIGMGLEQDEEKRDGNARRKKKEKAFESHDPKTGELLQRSADDSSLSLAELVRQERFSGGSADQKNMDSEMANRIASDGKFINSLDYVDENAESLARKKMKSEVLKKAFAVQDYARTKKALDSCNLCFSDSGGPPRAAMVALGTRTYLGLMENEELVKGHCRIIPIQHHFSSLEAEDETWDEIKNFMKTLMQMFAEEDKGVVFFESVINIKSQRHTSIEAIPIPFDLFDEIPGYFQEAILSSEQEWSQHKKLITFTPARPFRRSLVPNLPYFAIQWDYKGEKGFGHVIEGVDDGPEHDADGEEMRGEVGEKGGGEFSRYFAQEIIGNLMDLEPRQWRKPRRIDFRSNRERVDKFKVKYDKYDWTKALSG